MRLNYWLSIVWLVCLTVVTGWFFVTSDKRSEILQACAITVGIVIVVLITIKTLFVVFPDRK